MLQLSSFEMLLELKSAIFLCSALTSRDDVHTQPITAGWISAAEMEPTAFTRCWSLSWFLNVFLLLCTTPTGERDPI